MNRVFPHQQPKQKNGAVGERKKQAVPPRNSPAAAPSSSASSFSSSPSSSSQSESPSLLTGASTPVTIQQDSRTETEIEKLKKKVHDLTWELQQQKSRVEVTEKEQFHVATAAYRLREGINEATIILTEGQASEMSDNDEQTDENLIDHLEKACAKMIEKNRSLRRENKLLTEEFQKQEQLNKQNVEAYEQKNEELVECRHRETQLEHEIKTLKDQADRGRTMRAARAKQEQADREQVEQERATENNHARQQITQLQGEIQRLSNHQVARDREIREQADELVAQQERIKQLEHENQRLTEQLALKRENREQAEERARELAAEGRAAQQEWITQLELENQRLTEQGRLEREARNQAQEQAREQAAQLQAAQGQVAAVQAQNDTLTQANNGLRTRVEELQDQQNELQQRNNALEAQRRDNVDLILAILVAQQLRENILAYHYNVLLRQHDITRNDNEQLVQALVNTVNRHEDELAIVLCQMAEIAHIPGANDTNPRRSQQRSRPELRLVQNGSQRHSEYVKSCPSLDLSSNISEHISLRCFLPGH
ncbi:hypothetical protein DPV78_006345 [Talaromyces pinophilus]|nr:hypothetical protein DPV78_006345 [Talaromyces pinophilus]